MSDDEEMIYKKPQNSIHYGTLENSEWLKQPEPLEEIQSDEDDYEPEAKKPAIAATTATATATVPQSSSSSSANINTSSEYFDLEHEM